MEKLFSVKTAAKHYSYSEAYFRKLIKQNTIPSVKIGYSRRIKKSVLDAFFEEKMVPASA